MSEATEFSGRVIEATGKVEAALQRVGKSMSNLAQQIEEGMRAYNEWFDSLTPSVQAHLTRALNHTKRREMYHRRYARRGGKK